MSTIRTHVSVAPPVMEARRWLEGVQFSDERPLINVSQAAPVAPPPQALRQKIAEIALTRDDAHLYGPVLGLDALREALAARTSALYRGTLAHRHTAITSGCNQAFAAAIMTLCGEGDAVILPTPWYFNHKMWLDMVGVETTPLPCGPGLLPDPKDAAARITPRTRAIVLVTPNNPCGSEYPPALIEGFFALAQRHGLALILDETYRDFHSQPGPPHALFADPDWPQTLIHLYSFSKAYRLTGHRVGAMITSEDRLAQAEKFLDTVAICPAQLGQHAALWGLEILDDWLAGERQEILRRRDAVIRAMDTLTPKGWQLLGVGAYFAYLRHPFAMGSDALARSLVQEAGILALPGTMFAPQDSPTAAQEMRIAFANLDSAGLQILAARLAALELGT